MSTQPMSTSLKHLGGLPPNSKTVFMFAGRGLEWIGMGRELYATEPIFRKIFDQCEEACSPYIDWVLSEELHRDEPDNRFDEDTVAEPLLFAIQLGLVALWETVNVEPDAVIGYSIGEFAAAYTAGVLSLDDAARLVCLCSQGVDKIRGQGVMGVVNLSLEDAEEVVAPYGNDLVVAIHSSPSWTVLSGKADAMEQVFETLRAQEIFCRLVQIRLAAHSPQLEPVVPFMQEAFGPIQPQTAQLPIYSAVTQQITLGPDMDAAYWVRMVRHRINFAEMLEAMVKDGYTTFVEIGVHPALSDMVREILMLHGKSGQVVHSLQRDTGERSELSSNMTKLLSPSTEGTDSSMADGIATQFLARVLAAPANRRQTLLTKHLQTQIAEVLDLPDSQSVPLLEGFTDLGMNSLSTVQLRNRLQESLGYQLPVTLAFDYPTVDALASYLLSQVQEGEASNTSGLEAEKLAETDTLANYEELFANAQPTADDDASSRSQPLSTKQQAWIEQAFTELQAAKHKLHALAEAQSEPIAIIGMGTRLPGANSPAAFWDLLSNEVDAIREVPKERWDIDAYFEANPTAGKMYTRHGGFLDDISGFDPQFFRISPREALTIDPQHRLLLEVTWEALEHAGIDPDALSGSQTGVFLGLSNNDYLSQVIQQPSEVLDAYGGSGTTHSIAAGRISHLLNLKGPSLVLDTACSSSLVATHFAVKSLRNGECQLALVGGVNALLAPEIFIMFSQAQMLSPAGRCKAFDASADGYVRSEGSGMVVLKRLSDAVADGDNIFAVIQGSAINHDGRASGLTVPNGPAQQAVVRDALANAHLTPADVSYVETHGTGTSLGDPIEVGALGAVFQQREQPLIIGSAKTNVGHLESAAGVTGLIKTVLSIHHGEIPSNLHFREPSPHIPWDEMSITVASQKQAWPNGPRIAGVSALGFSGTNAHVILGEAPAQQDLFQQDTSLENNVLSNGTESTSTMQDALVRMERSHHLLSLSARTENALADLVEKYGASLAESPSLPIADICFTANTGRTHFDQRLSVVAESTDELGRKLAAHANGERQVGVWRGEVPDAKPKIAFLFTGQGAQYAGMGRTLYETQPTFRQTIDRCDEILQSHLEQSLLDVLYPPPQAEEMPVDEALIHETTYAQPALFAIEYALAQLWQSWGITPDVVYGHSTGEYVAACVAGVFSLEDGLKLIAARARLIHNSSDNSATASIFADETQVQEFLVPYAGSVGIAGINGPKETLVAGMAEDVEAVVEAVREAGMDGKRLAISHAAHSPLMEPILDEFEQIAQGITYHSSHTDLISNTSGELVDTIDAAYWRRHMIEPVRFADGVVQLEQLGCSVMLEVGPQPVLMWLGRQAWRGPKGVKWLASLWSARGDWEQLLQSAGELYVAGVDLDWRGFDHDYSRRKVVLPTYPFQRQRYWIERTPQLQPDTVITANQPAEVDPNEWLYEVKWKAQPLAPSSAKSTQAGRWLVVANPGVQANAINKVLREQGGQATFIFPEGSTATDDLDAHVIDPADQGAWRALFGQLLVPDAEPYHGLLYLWGIDAHADESDLTGASLIKAKQQTALYPMQMVQALLAVESPQLPKLWITTQGTQDVATSVSTTAIEHPLQAILWGIGRTIAVEHPEIWGGLIDVEAGQPLDGPHLAHLLTVLRGEHGEDQFAIVQEQIYVPRLVRREAPAAIGTMPMRDDGTYLIIGGLGLFGLTVTRWLIEQGAKSLVLLNRSGPSEEAAKAIAELAQNGVTIKTVQADVTDYQQMSQVVETIEQSGTPLRGVIQMAAVFDMQNLSQQSWDKADAVLAPKVDGSWNLHLLTCDKELDFFVMFSSMAALFGASNLGTYGAANTFLDGLAHYRRGRNLPATSINWGPVAETAEVDRLDDDILHAWDVQGINWLQPLPGLRLMGQLLAGSLDASLADSLAQVSIISVDWQKYVRFSFGQQQSLLKDIASDSQAHNGQSPTDEQSIFPLVQQATPDERLDLIQSFVQQQISTTLQLDIKEVRPNLNLLEIGMDSLMAMSVLNACRQDLQITLYPRELYNHPVIHQFSQYLTTEFMRLHGNGTPSELDENRGTDASNEAAAGNRNTPSRVATVDGIWLRERTFARPQKRLSSATFILSPPRSGSTLLRIMLAGHPQLFSPPELHLLWLENMGEHPALGDLGEGLQRAMMDLRGIDATESQRLIDDLVQQEASIGEVYAHLQELCGERLLVDKSPSYASNPNILQRAEQLFDQPNYIHLTRHPYAMIESFMRMRIDRLMGYTGDEPVSIGEEIWQTENRNIRTFLAQIPAERQLAIAYEDLARQPTKTMYQICDLLDIPFDEAMISPYDGERMVDGVHEQSAAIGDQNFLGYGKLKPEMADTWRTISLPRRLGHETQQMAADLGYTLPHEQNGAGQNGTSRNGTGQNETGQNGHRLPAQLGERPTVAIRERTLTVQGLALCLCEWGEATNEANNGTIIFVHGARDHGASWDGVASQLAAANYHVMAPDLRGHGRSEHVGPGGSYSLLDFAGDLDAIVKSLDAPDVTLVGHSMGATVAALYSAVRPERVRQLVLIEPVMGLGQSAEPRTSQLATYLDNRTLIPEHPILPSMDEAVVRLQQAMPALSTEMAQAMATRITKPTDDGLTWRWDPRLQLATNSLLFMEQEEHLAQLKQLNMPVTLIYGTKSEWRKPEDERNLQTILSINDPLILQGGHNLHIDAAVNLAHAISRVAQREYA